MQVRKTLQLPCGNRSERSADVSSCLPYADGLIAKVRSMDGLGVAWGAIVDLKEL